MKKLGKALSKSLKVFFAFGLLFTNISSLSIVFADEISESDSSDTVYVGESGKKTLGDEGQDTGDSELDEEDKQDGEEIGEEEGNEEEEEENKEENSEETEEENNEEENTEGENEENNEENEESNEETNIDGGGEQAEENKVDVTFEYKVFVGETEVTESNGVYDVGKTANNVTIKGVLTSEVADDAAFTYDDTLYDASVLKDGIIVSEVELTGYLYGEFTTSVAGTLVDADEVSTSYQKDIVIKYGTEDDITAALSDGVSALSLQYTIDGDKISGLVVDTSDIEELVGNVFDKATCSFTNDEVTISDDHGVTITYKIVIIGDVDGDGDVDNDDLELLINQVIGAEETTDNSDLDGDGNATITDVIYLYNMLNNDDYTNDIREDSLSVTSRFSDITDDIYTGDEFTLEYIVTLNEQSINGLSGMISYDKSMLELINASVINFSSGNVNDGKFLYMGDNLALDITTTTDDDGNVVTTYNDVDYVILELQFKALQEGSASVSVDDTVYISDEVYGSGASASTTVNIVSSDDNSLSSLKVAGEDIQLSDGVYEYSITVGNDVTSADIEYALANDSASVTSIVAPEELAVGDNTITITVMSASGEEVTYTITVTREEEKDEEETNNVSRMNYQENNNNNNDSKINDDTTDNDKKTDDKDKDQKDKKDDDKLSRIIIIILILLAIAGLIFLVLRDEDEDEETKKANRDIEKFKKEDNLKEKSNKKENKPKKTNKKGR